MQVKEYKIVCGDVHAEIVLDCCDDLDNVIVTLIAAAGIKNSEKQDTMGLSRVLNRIERATEALAVVEKELGDKLYNKNTTPQDEQ